MKITFVDRSLVSEGDGVLPLTQLETMVKNEEFNTENFSCDPASLVVKPYVTCQAGQILLNGLCGIIYFYIYANFRYDSFINSFQAVINFSLI
jgi:hypothetical protein